MASQNINESESNQKNSISNYRAYTDNYIDAGKELLVILPGAPVLYHSPNFYARNTFQTWDVSNSTTYDIHVWIGDTLGNRTLHEIIIPNNSNFDSVLTFSDNYLLVDEEEGVELDKQITTVPANTVAHYYCTAIFENGDLFLHLRVGSQDTRPPTIPFS
jgi:hypothetical protein